MSDSREMLDVKSAQALILEHFERLPSELIHTANALGRILAEDVKAQHDIPPFTNSAMDGYALRSDDIQSASPENPVDLRVIEDITAGKPPQRSVERGTAARIMTGAHFPDGADAIVPVEDTNEDWRASGRNELPAPEVIEIRASAKPEQHVRPAGEDMQAGSVGLTAGTRLRPQEVGMLAALGAPTIHVVQRPKIAVLSTGNELLPIDAEIEPGKIRDVNRYTLMSLVEQSGAEPLWMGVAADEPDDVRIRLQTAIVEGAHLILSSAGVSVGAYDVVRAVLAEMGQINFWRVRVRPGKPLAFGLIDETPFLGVPGNPVSAIVSFHLFARPAILKLGGHNPEVETIPVVLGESLHSNGKRETYIRVRVERERDDGQLTAHSVGSQGSNLLMSMVRANALLIVPEGVTHAREGDVMQAIMLDR